MKTKRTVTKVLIYAILLLLSAVFLTPVVIILINSVKGNFYISHSPFSFPDAETFVGFENFIKGFTQSDFMRSFANSAFITVFSVIGIVLLTSMTAWYIVRIKNRITKLMYYLF